MATNFQPSVIHPIEVSDFLYFILEHHFAPSTLIVCSSQASFLQQLSASIEYQSRKRQGAEIDDGQPSSSGDTQRPVDPSTGQPFTSEHPLLIPTLHQLSCSTTLKLAFCPSLESLRAYLCVYNLDETLPFDNPTPSENATYILGGRTVHRQPLLALLNPINLHRNTSNFSAQGLSRTLASAVEAAHRSHQRLILAECPSPVHIPNAEGGLTTNDDDREMEEAEEGEEQGQMEDPLEQQVAILNVTTRTFGAGERGWAGRTVKLRRIVERWCRVEPPPDMGFGDP
jgi:hypothetical protein